jgi:predicted aldo/keto reductase-like oxidoreductase
MGGVPVEAVRDVLKAALSCDVTYLEIGPHADPVREEALCRFAGEAGRASSAALFVTVSLRPEHYVAGFDLKAHLRERAAWLGVKVIDGLDFSGLDRAAWPRLVVSDLLDVARQSSLVRYLGFSFYDQPLYLRPVLQEFAGWSFCRVNASFMDADRLPGASGLIAAAADAGLAVVAAEPLLEGRLVENIPPSVAALWGGRSPAEYALRWAWHQAGVATTSVTVRTPAEVEAYAALAAKPEPLSVREEVLVSRVRDAYRALRPVPCTTCRACMPCQGGIDAPRLFELYNDAVMYADRAYGREALEREQHDVSLCDECGDCARRCGRRIDIPTRVKEAADYLRGKPS